MAKLHLKPQAHEGRVQHITPPSAGWHYVGFDVWQQPEGQVITGFETAREVCLVFIQGHGTLEMGGQSHGRLGERTSPFEGKPCAVYIPPHVAWSVKATSALTLAVCSAPAIGRYPARLIDPAHMTQEKRGIGSNTRYVTNILSEAEEAESLLVVEVITPQGHTSSYPPHKHDQDNLPTESLLEETYYHRLSPPQGFAFQRIYTDDRTLDEALAVEDGDVTLVPKGYHPTATVHGYDLYYLNVMAGPQRIWRFHNAPEHAWLLKS